MVYVVSSWLGFRRGFLNDMRYINPRFTYLLTYLQVHTVLLFSYLGVYLLSFSGYLLTTL